MKSERMPIDNYKLPPQSFEIFILLAVQCLPYYSIIDGAEGALIIFTGVPQREKMLL